MKYLCTSQNAYLCRCAIANFTLSEICNNASGFHFEEQQWPARIDIASSNVVENGSYELLW